MDCSTCPAKCCRELSIEFTAAEAQVLRDQYPEITYEPQAIFGDVVVMPSPCPYLDKSNKCLAYEHRPAHCRAFPFIGVPFKEHPIVGLGINTLCPNLLWATSNENDAVDWRLQAIRDEFIVHVQGASINKQFTPEQRDRYNVFNQSHQHSFVVLYSNFVPLSWWQEQLMKTVKK